MVIRILLFINTLVYFILCISSFKCVGRLKKIAKKMCNITPYRITVKHMDCRNCLYIEMFFYKNLHKFDLTVLRV